MKEITTVKQELRSSRVLAGQRSNVCRADHGFVHGVRSPGSVLIFSDFYSRLFLACPC